MPINTGWKYGPSGSPLDQLTSQTQAESNPNVRGDNGSASASSPFLSAALSNSSGDTLTNLSSTNRSWAYTAQGINNTDKQALANENQDLAYKRSQDAFQQQQKRLQQLNAAAEKAGNAVAAKAAQTEAAIQAQMQAQSTYNAGYGDRQGSGSIQGAQGVSAAGRSQLAIARADGYNLGSSNYDRTYRYNNAYSVDRNKALTGAYSYLGTHYVLGGEKNQVAVDCSGLVQSVYSQLGYNIPMHSATWEKNNIPGVRTSFNNLQPGDLVCWKDGSHIAVYAGNGQIIEAANTKVGTVRRPLWDSPNNVVGIHLTFADERGGSSASKQNLAQKKGFG